MNSIYLCIYGKKTGKINQIESIEGGTRIFWQVGILVIQGNGNGI